MAIKINLKKAYDKLKWSFIDVVLKELNSLDTIHRIVIQLFSVSLLLPWMFSKLDPKLVFLSLLGEPNKRIPSSLICLSYVWKNYPTSF